MRPDPLPLAEAARDLLRAVRSLDAAIEGPDPQRVLDALARRQQALRVLQGLRPADLGADLRRDLHQALAAERAALARARERLAGLRGELATLRAARSVSARLGAGAQAARFVSRRV